MQKPRSETGLLPEGACIEVVPYGVFKRNVLFILGNTLTWCIVQKNGTTTHCDYTYRCSNGYLRLKAPGQRGRIPYRLSRKGSLWLGRVEYRWV